MHGLRGNGAREKTALMPDPLWRSSCGFTTQDSRRGYGHGAPLEGAVGTLPQSAALGSLGRPDGSLWSLSIEHDVCYVKGRWFATFLSWGSLGHLILRAFPRGVLGGSSGGT